MRGRTQRSRLRWLRWVTVGLAMLVALVLLTTAAVALALRAPGVQQSVIEGVSELLEADLGFSIAAEGFDLGLLGGRLDIRDLRLRSGIEEPFARIERVRIRFVPVSLLGSRIRLRLLELERPNVDLDAALPGRAATESEPLESLPLTIDEVRIKGGQIAVSAPGLAGESLETWRARDLAVEACFDGGRLTLEDVRAEVRIGRGGETPIELRIQAAAEMDLSGRMDIERLGVIGEEIAIEASFRRGLAWSDSAGRIRVEADPGYLLRGAHSGRVRLEGQADLAAWTGSARLEGLDQPAALLAELLPLELADRLELGATELDLSLDLRLEKGIDDRREVVGDLGVVASRGTEPILEVAARPRFSLGERTPDELAADLDAELRLLPGEPGSRAVFARMSAVEAMRMETWGIDDGVFEIEQPSIERLLTVLSGLWPKLLPISTVRAMPELGALAASGAFRGVPRNPRIDARAEIRPGGDERIELTAEGRPVSGAWKVRATGSELEIGRFTAGVSGTFDFSAEVSDPLGAASGLFELAARNLATASGEVLSKADLGLEGTPDRLAWRFEGAISKGGAVSGRGKVEPEGPLRRAGGELSWQTADDRMPRIDVAFELSRGVGSAMATVPARPDLTAQLEVPLGALAALPQLPDFSAFPFGTSTGPAVLAWRVPEGDWRELLSPAWQQRFGRLEGGFTGQLSLDLGCLACSTGSAQIQGLLVELDGRRAAAPGGWRVSLAEGTALVDSLSVEGEGLALEAAAKVDLSPTWRPGESVSKLISDSRANLSATVESSWLETLPIEIVAPGTLRLEARASGPPQALAGSGSLAAPGLRFTLDSYPAAVLEGPSAEIGIEKGQVEWKNARLLVEGVNVSSEGRARLADPLAEALGILRVDSGLSVVTAAALPFEITEGWLAIEQGRLATVGGEGILRLDLPLAAGAGAMAWVEWYLPVNDWAPLIDRLGAGEDPEVLEFASRGALRLPIDRPAATEAEIELTSGRIVVRGRETVLEPGLNLLVADGLLQLMPFELRTASEKFRFEARAALGKDWAFADPPAALFESFELLGTGEIDAGLLNPFLGGGRAEGSLRLDLDVKGAPEAFGGTVNVDGPDASILYRSPYLARLQEPSLEISIRDGRIALERGSLLLNEGELEVTGLVLEEGRSDLSVRLSDSAFRLDYGLLATLGGDLRYRLGADGESEISGSVDLERGALTRSVQLDLDLLSQLLAPIDLTTTEDDPMSLISLDLEVRTREGVRVKNNLGDLLVRWEPLEVTGTLARPIVRGRLEVDPGGLLYAYGQTVRLDRAVIEYPGEDGVEPRLDFEATTSLEDPTIGQLAGDDPFRATSKKQEQAGPSRDEITADLARYYGEQFAGRLGESVGVSLSLRPLLIFGETDPGARLTVSRDLSVNLALAASVDLRSAEARTYLLEAHELRALPRLVAQGFTDDASAYGGALLQRQEFGGSRRVLEGDLPRISKIVVDPPKRVSRRGIKRALAVEKGDLFDPRRRFVAEVELVDYLMRKGYPDARVSVRTVPDQRRERRVRLEVEIQPGPFVEFEFQGEKIPKPLRALIRSLYRPDFFEPESIAEMKIETVRALRSLGFLAPQVETLIELENREVPASDRRVVVRTLGGTKMSAEPPIFLGLPAEDVEVLNVVFANAVQRVELAVGLPSADRRLILALEALGYPEARIVSRYQTLDERVLTVELDSGPRQRIADVIVEGVGLDRTPDVGEDEVRAWLEVAPGDPLRRNRVSRSALAVERQLGSRGYLDARVRTVVEAADSDDTYARRVRFEVEPGLLSRLAEVEFEGLRSTRERFARGVTDLETGRPLARDDLARARTALWRTGLFSGVGTETFEVEPGRERVVFDLEERDRYRLTYGVRWDSEDGTGAVLDATDDNFLGRGWTLGLRALTSNEEDSLRWLTRVPRAFGGPGSLELFAASRELVEVRPATIFSPKVDVPVDVLEGTLQYSHPVTGQTTLRIYGRYTDKELKDPDPLFASRIKNPQLGFQYLYDKRSPELVTERGVLASIDLSGSEDFLGGDLRYARIFSQLSLYRPAGTFLGSRLSWAQAYRIGVAEAFDDRELTTDVRFFAGGEYSVRGYETESLGKLEQSGSFVKRSSESALLIINQELRWRLFDDFTLVLFTDAGNVWQEIDDLGSDLFTSAGLGVRAVTPVGLLRLDIAHALKRRFGIDPEFKIYFGLGTTF